MKFYLNNNKKMDIVVSYLRRLNLMLSSYIRTSLLSNLHLHPVALFPLPLPPSPISIPFLGNSKVSSFAAHCRQPLLFFQVLEAVFALALPTHKIAGEGEDGSVDGDPGEEDAKVEAEPGMQVKQDLMFGFDDCERRGES